MKRIVSLLAVAALAVTFANGCAAKFKTCKEANKDQCEKAEFFAKDRTDKACKWNADANDKKGACEVAPAEPTKEEKDKAAAEAAKKALAAAEAICAPISGMATDDADDAPKGKTKCEAAAAGEGHKCVWTWDTAEEGDDKAGTCKAEADAPKK